MKKIEKTGQSLVELLVALGLLAVLLPGLVISLTTPLVGKPQQQQRTTATNLMKETYEALRSVREKGWPNIATNGTYHPAVSGSSWSLATGPETVNGLTRQLVISDVYRDASGAITTPGAGTLDPSTKALTATVSWSLPYQSSIQESWYETRYVGNTSFTQTTVADFSAGTLGNTQITNTAGGEVTLANNNRARWCSPALSSATIDLPDGPPVAVAATASATTTSVPNDVFTATAPNDSNSVKMAYLTVTANTDIPIPTLVGTFTLDPSKYSNPSYVPSGIGLDNNFRTNDIKYYTSSGGNLYALVATDKPDHEVVVVQIKSGGANSFQDPTNKIYKYWTFFNTRQYQGDSRSTPNQDQAPFGYGGVALATFGNRGYVASGGYLYVFDLSNIDSKSPSNGLDMVGCRIQLDGYDCQPGLGTDMKYGSGQTGTSWSDTTSPVHDNCSDGGNIELYADHQLSVAQSGSSTYVFVAVGAGTNPELDVTNVTSVPTGSSSPKISSSSCGRTSGGSGWKTVGSLDFNSATGTEEAANSVYARSDSNRVYMSSNGGIDANHDGKPDSDQFYIIDTTNKSSPKFLSGTPSTGAQSGYYNGNATNIELFPRRSLTVLSGGRAIIVGQDGYPSDGIEPQEYQVLNIENEAGPAYCGGLNFQPGFNDLTSVSEADGDNFVYMVANTMEKQLKIIQGGPDTGIYVPMGTFQSSIFDARSSVAFNRLSATINQPANTSIQMQAAVAAPVNNSCSGASFNYVGPGGSTSTYFSTLSGTTINGVIPLGTYGTFQNPNQCFSYKAILNTADTNQTPTIYDVSVNYSP